jgi:hypothetical protein
MNAYHGIITVAYMMISMPISTHQYSSVALCPRMSWPVGLADCIYIAFDTTCLPVKLIADCCRMFSSSFLQ